MLAAMSDGWTFASLIDAGMAVQAYCDDCRFNKPLDMAPLANRLGPDHPAMAADLQRIMVCPRCNSRRTSFIYSPDLAAQAGFPGSYGFRAGAPEQSAPGRTHRSRSRRRRS